MSATGLPFDDIRALVARMPGPDRDALKAKRRRESRLAKPEKSLGRLEDLSDWLAAWQGRAPAVRRPVVAVFAGTHGAFFRGPERTRHAVESVAAGGAAVNQICAANDLGLKVFDLALDLPTGDIRREAALDERACAATMAFGMECVTGEPDLLCLGETAEGGALSALAILAALHGGSADIWTADEAQRAPLEEALRTHAGHLRDPLEVLRRLGGRESAAIAGAILAARTQRVPVILDGLSATAAAAVLHRLDETALDHCLFAQVTAEPGHRVALEALGKVPLLALGLSIGQGTGAAIAAGIVRAAALCHSGMADAPPTH